MGARICIVDDHEVLREGLKSLLAKSRSDWEICAEAANGKQAIEVAKKLTPDLLILDISMPVMSGFEATVKMRKLGLNVPVLIFTTHQFDRLEEEVRRAGAQGYVLKSQAARDLVLAIETLLGGGTFYGASPKPEPGPGRASKAKPLFRQTLSFAY